MTIRILMEDSKENTVGAVCSDIVITFVVRLITTAETNQMVVNCGVGLTVYKGPGAP